MYILVFESFGGGIELIRMKYMLLLLCIPLMIFSSCSKQPDGSITDPLNSEKSEEYPNVQVEAKNIECDYIEPIYGEIETFSFSVEDGMLEDVLNYWIKEKAKMGISYGNTSSGENILDELFVVDAYLEGTDLAIVMNDTFMAFETSDFDNYTNVGNFVFGLKNIVSQVTNAESMTIYYNNKKSGVINPEGYLIDNIPLKD